MNNLVRMDVIITFGAQKFVVELKIWNGRKYEEKDLEQLTEYLESQKLFQLQRQQEVFDPMAGGKMQEVMFTSYYLYFANSN